VTVEAVSAGPRFAAFCEHYVRHTKGRWAGRPLTFEPWQREMVDEILRIGPDGRRVYQQALVGLPRKNGKSTLCSGLALYLAAADDEPGPEVIVASGSREQAAVVFDQTRAFVEQSPGLLDWFRPFRYHIALPGVDGVIKRISADGRLQHGLSPNGIIVDELHAFTTPRQSELWDALITATGARAEPLTVAITTAGYDKATVLGRLFDKALDLDVERRPGLTIARDPEAGFLLWWYGADEDSDLEDEAAWMTANPASWITIPELRRQLASPTMDENTFRRLHLNQWTKARDAWLPAGCWPALRDTGLAIPEGAEVWLGVDVGISDDSTAVAIAWRLEDGRTGLAAHVWATRYEHKAHEHVVGGRVRLEQIEDHIRALARRFLVRELVYDPRFFERSAQSLSDEGLTVAPFEQSSKLMGDACQLFYRAARQGMLAHDGDPVLAAHVEATAAEQTERGWRIRKLRSSQKIDACVASVMAHARAVESGGGSYLMFA
jgi:phage terminase large subunit-like protein